MTKRLVVELTFILAHVIIYMVEFKVRDIAKFLKCKYVLWRCNVGWKHSSTNSQSSMLVLWVLDMYCIIRILLSLSGGEWECQLTVAVAKLNECWYLRVQYGHTYIYIACQHLTSPHTIIMHESCYWNLHSICFLSWSLCITEWPHTHVLNIS